MTIRTQTRSPGTVVSDDSVGTVAWSDPEGAESEGGDAANATGPGTTEYLLADTYGFDLLPTAVPLTALLGARRKGGSLGSTNLNTPAGAGTTRIRGVAIGPDGEMLIVGGSYVRTSTDGGANWTNRQTGAGAGSADIRGCAIGPDGVMLIVGRSGFVRLSTDGGTNWTNLNTATGAGSSHLDRCAIGPDGEMIIVGEGGFIATSTDNGASWTDRKTAAGVGSTNLNDCAIGASGEMLFVGNNSFIRISTDDGANWTNLATTAGATGTIHACAIGTDGTMIAGGVTGWLRTSTDGGDSWTDRKTAAGTGSASVQSVAVGPNGELLAVGGDGYVSTSADGGATWISRTAVAGAGTTSLEASAIGPSGQMLVGGFSGYIRLLSFLTAVDDGVCLVVGGSPSGSNLSAIAVWAGDYQTDTFGPVDISALTPAQVNASGFGFAISAVLNGAAEASVDHMPVTVSYDVAVDVDITAPTDDGTITSPGVEVEWGAEVGGSAIMQASKRVRVLRKSNGALLYDSGILANATKSHVIGSGTPATAWADPQNGIVVRIRVDLVEDGTADPDGVGDAISGFAEIEVTTDWTPPTAPTGLAVTFVTESA